MYPGPSPKVPYNRNRFLSTYRNFWDYSGGYITDFGNHRLDTMPQLTECVRGPTQSPRQAEAS